MARGLPVKQAIQKFLKRRVIQGDLVAGHVAILKTFDKS